MRSNDFTVSVEAIEQNDAELIMLVSRVGDQVTRRLIALEEQVIKDALIARGWTPPGNVGATAGAVPDGWKLVPMEPTKEMRKAGGFASDSCWSNMLAAAPQPPAEAQGPVAWMRDLDIYDPTNSGPEFSHKQKKKSEGWVPLYPAPQQTQDPGCTRSHPHENMDDFCKLRSQIAKLTNENARIKAQQAAPAERGDATMEAMVIALEVLQKHRQMKGDWPVGELGRRAAEQLSAVLAAQAAQAAQKGDA